MNSFWKGWRHFKGNNRVVRDNIVGYVNDKEVCDKFTDVFQDSFNDSRSDGWAIDKLNDMLLDLHNCFRNQQIPQILHCLRYFTLLII